jgi:hypothetical protein
MVPQNQKSAFWKALQAVNSAAPLNSTVISCECKSHGSDWENASLDIPTVIVVEDNVLQYISKPDTNDVLLGRGSGK